MASFFKKINPNSKSPKPGAVYDSPPTASLPSPPVNQLKGEFNKRKLFPHKEKDPKYRSVSYDVPAPGARNTENYDSSNPNDTVGSASSNTTSHSHRTSNPPSRNTSYTHETRHEQVPAQTQMHTPNGAGTLLHPTAGGGTAGTSNNSNHSYGSNNSNNSGPAVTPWRKKKLYNSPFPRFGHAVSSLTSTSGTCYLMGGLSGNDVYGDMWVIEPIRNQDSSGTDSPYIASPIENPQKIPSPRTGHASILIGNAFIIFAGDTAINYDQSLDNKLYFFNISSLKWTITSPEGPKPCGRYGHQIAVLNFEISPSKWSSQLFVFGGQLNDQYFNDLWRFDLSKFKDPNNQWVRIHAKGDLPPPLANYTMTACNDRLYLYGGHNSGHINDQLYCYDALKNEWAICKLHGISPPALYGHSTTIFGTLLLIYGGRLPNDTNSGDLFVIDLSTFRCWRLQPNLPYSPGPRYGHSITVNPVDEKIIIMGGDIYDNDFNGIDDSSIGMIDEAKFSLLSSVIYECDIKLLEKFTDKSSMAISNSSEAEVSSVPFSAVTAATSNKAETGSATLASDSRTTFPTSFGRDKVRKSQLNIDLNDTSPSQPPHSPTSASTDPLVSSTPLHSADEEDYVSVDESVVHGTAKRPSEKLYMTSESPFSNSDTRNLSDSTQIKHDLDEKSRNHEVLDNEIFESENTDNIKNESTFANTNVQTDPVSDLIYKTPENDETSKLKKLTAISSNSNTTSTSVSNMTAKSVDEDEVYDDIPSNFATPSLQQFSTMPFSNSATPFSPALVERDNVKLMRLIQMVNDVKAEMKQSVSQANSQIVTLEAEKKELLEKLNAESRGNDSSMIEKNLQLESFIKDELSTIPALNSLIKEQQETINRLSAKVQGEELLQEKIYNLEAQNSSLNSKLENFFVIHGVTAVGEEGQSKDVSKAIQPTNFESVTTKVDALLEKWNNAAPHSGVLKEIDHLKQTNFNLSKQIEDSSSKFKEFEELYTESRNSLNKSHRALLLSQSETNKLKDQIKVLSNELEELKLKKRVFSNSNPRKPSYNRSLNSSTNANSTNKAVSSHGEGVEPNDLNGSNHAVNEGATNQSNTRNAGSVREIDNFDGENGEIDESTSQHDISFVDDRYEIRIKDLEANLFIISQERDQMREELISLKKQIYNTRNNASFSSSPVVSSPNI